ncbi:MAG: hypothetical protein A2W99_15750 [Bacteroidetes bacterium GWF2_33_16]|nr:MAG: hypothetical protein A2X00_15095 [Bacteroidetes bacterium GWE2_32_14]OFY02359.1 MAG: hypothetical protein A2W99_15750 [Bacteroidetes bacterium GWF2_33_16]
MIKHLVLLVYMGVLLALNSIFSDKVSLVLHSSDQVEAGSEIYVEITLNKSDFESFARFQQEIPAGLTPIPVTTANADFSFNDQKLKFIWLKLPGDEEITISYKLQVDQRLKGRFNLNGKFSYIAENERRSVDITPKIVVITPSPSIDPSLIVDIADFKPLATPSYILADANQVKCIRQIPYKAQGSDEYIVNLLVNKGNKEKFAKIQETVPAGYTAVSIENKDAIFTFKDQTVKLLWMNLPNEPYFVVSYKLVPAPEKTEKPSLAGTFSFIENDNTLSMDIQERDVNLTNRSDENLMAALSSIPSTTSLSEPTAKPYDHSGKVKIEIAESALKLLRQDTRLTQMLEPENGVYYRVQVAAGHRPIDINKYFKKYNLDKEVRTELHEGWRKYSVGSFAVYKAARDYRVHIWNTTTIDDAFVAAYNNGKRITVQEALMITNHDWVR